MLQGLIKPEVLKDSTSVVNLLKIEFDKTLNNAVSSKLKVGFAAKGILHVHELKEKMKFSDRQVFEFKMECKGFLVKLTKKRLETSPLSYLLVRNMIFLDPRMFISDKVLFVERLTRILRIMKDGGRIRDSECDDVLKHFNFFHEKSLSEDSDAFSGFSID